MTNCKQIKCCFLGTESCPKCCECGSTANVVDDNCVSCYLCEKEEGELRGSPNIKKEIDELLVIKVK